jgi:eukaryotic-like serine/threonine-protein kinase
MSLPLGLDPAAWARLRPLLDEALDQPAASREAWLAALPPEQADLAAPLRRLLAHADDPLEGSGEHSRFSALPVLAGDLGEAADDAAEVPPDVGPYRAIRLLGVGGMSSVWLAERTDVLLNRPVALKLPKATWRHVGLAQRMAQEREILAVLDHPHIARIYDAGVAADGQPYLALEYVEGRPIDAYCRERHLPLRDRVELFLQVADAVAHAHAKLVVHRDLKPSNILVTEAGQARLLDFGIAKLIGEAQAGQPELTQNAARVMTPWYAAPEQVRGEPVSTATDTYALGVVLFELLTGSRPYRLPRDTAAALEEAILQQEPVRPSSVVQDRRLARQLAGDLDTIVQCALRKAPAERYATVTALADDLRHWLADRPVLARPDGARYRFVKYLRRNRLALGVVGVVVLSLSAGLAAALWQRERAVQEAAKANAIKDYLIGLFEANDIEQRDGLKKRQQSVQQLLEGSVDGLGRSLQAQPEVRDELQAVVGGLLQDLALTDAALKVRTQRVQDLAASGGPRLARLQALHDLATSERQRGDRVAARKTIEQALADCRQATPADERVCASVRQEAGVLAFADKRLDDALALIEPLVPDLRRLAPQSLEMADALDTLGTLRLERNRPEEAYQLLQESIGIKRALWGADSVRLAMSRFRLGRNLWSMRHLAQADTELNEAWQIVRRALGESHVTSARIELSMGRLQTYVGLKPDGLKHLQHAARTLIGHPGHLAPAELLEAHVVLGNALLLDGQLDAAGPALQQALTLRERLGPNKSPDLTLDQSLARYWLDRGRYDESRATLVKLRERVVATWGPDHPDAADASLRMALAWMAQGRPAQAQQELDAVLASQDAREAVFGSAKHKAQLARAALWLEQGRPDLAQPIIDAQLATAQRTPRANQFREILFRLLDLAAHSRSLMGEHDLARRHFEQALALCTHLDPRHPYVAATRARFAMTLQALGEAAAARHQLDLAQQALAGPQELGDQFRRVVQRAALALARPAPTTQALDETTPPGPLKMSPMATTWPVPVPPSRSFQGLHRAGHTAAGRSSGSASPADPPLSKG